LRGLGELTGNEEEKEWIKNNLVRDLIFLLKLKVKTFSLPLEKT